jgi:polyphosphate kinase 2 (PPK2 family)
VVTDVPDRTAPLPPPGGILVADRCWCGPAPVAVDELVARERALLAGGVQLVKLWCSVRRPDTDPVAEAALVGATSTPGAPWTVLAADDEPRARLAALRHVLTAVDYRGRSDDVLGAPDPLLVVAVPARP